MSHVFDTSDLSQDVLDAFARKILPPQLHGDAWRGVARLLAEIRDAALLKGQEAATSGRTIGVDDLKLREREAAAVTDDEKIDVLIDRACFDAGAWLDVQPDGKPILHAHIKRALEMARAQWAEGRG